MLRVGGGLSLGGTFGVAPLRRGETGRGSREGTGQHLAASCGVDSRIRRPRCGVCDLFFGSVWGERADLKWTFAPLTMSASCRRGGTSEHEREGCGLGYEGSRRTGRGPGARRAAESRPGSFGSLGERRQRTRADEPSACAQSRPHRGLRQQCSC